MPPRSRSSQWRYAGVVALVTVAAFMPTLRNEFVNWDDPVNLLRNHRYRGLGWAQLAWMFTAFHMGHYIPVTWLTFGLDYVLWGMKPAGYHLTSLLIHAATAVVFYHVAAHLMRAAAPTRGEREPAVQVGAAVAALGFAIHPLRVESVAWATERRDVLCGLFYLVSVLAYLRGWMAGREARMIARGWYAAALAAAVLALLSKSMAVSLPFVLLILDVYPLRRLPASPARWLRPESRGILVEKVPFFLPAAAAGIAAFVAVGQGAKIYPLATIGIAARLAIVAYALAFYLWKTLLPVGLAPLYELPLPLVPWSPSFLLSGAVVASMSLAALAVRRRWPGFTAAWAAYVVILLPVSGLFQNGPQIAADRYTYLACLGWALLLGGGVMTAWQAGALSRTRRVGAAVLLGVVILALAGLGCLSWVQTSRWRESETLWRHAVEVWPSVNGHTNLGVALSDKGRSDEAVTHYRRALEMNPRDASAQHNLGAALARQGRREEAIEHYRRALEIDPQHAAAHHNWGVALGRLGQWDEAASHFAQALRIDRYRPETHTAWGIMLGQQGRWDEATQHFASALQLAPGDALALRNLEAARARTSPPPCNGDAGCSR